ncbi:MAG: FkbM family methyltransferase [Terracidiphilus sp.]
MEITLQAVKESVKHRFPGLTPSVRFARRLMTRAIDVMDSGIYLLTFGRGVLKTLRPGIRFRTHPTAWRWSFSNFAEGAYVEEEMNAFIGQCKAGMQLIDVGASYGAFSLVALTWPQSRALLIEPYPRSLRILRQIQRMNSLSGERFIIRPVAAGAQDGKLQVVDNRGIFFEASPNSPISVQMRSLDSLCGELGFRPTHIKIDVEGFEYEVLQGAARIIEQCMPVVHMEVHNTFLIRRGIEPTEIDAFMRTRGYDRLSALVENGADGEAFITRTVWRVGSEDRQAQGN